MLIDFHVLPLFFDMKTASTLILAGQLMMHELSYLEFVSAKVDYINMECGGVANDVLEILPSGNVFRHPWPLLHKVKLSTMNTTRSLLIALPYAPGSPGVCHTLIKFLIHIRILPIHSAIRLSESVDFLHFLLSQFEIKEVFVRPLVN